MNPTLSWRSAARRGLAALASLSLLNGLAAEPKLPPLTTVSGSPRLPGKFVWADLATDDVAAAQRFYSRWLGWTFVNLGNYTIASCQERPVCGMFQRERPANRPEAKPRWLSYISVKSVDRAQAAVTRGGGRVVAPPQTFPKRGEQAVFADPEGTLFGVIKSSGGDPEDVLPEPGEWIWMQLLSRDGRNATEFYREVAGYEVVENSSSNRLSDYVLTSKGYARATVRTLPSGRAGVQPNWLPFVRVSNVAQAVAKATELGGKTLIEPKPEWLQGKVAVIADPTGAAVGLLEWSEKLLKGGG